MDRGSATTRDAAVACAVGEARTPASELRRTKPQASPLTLRELEVARLIAEGLANGEIGSRLFISKRTVETHVTNMLNKLGLSSRMQLAPWVAGVRPT
jgi:non-specific serine/threonine protein kinase